MAQRRFVSIVIVSGAVNAGKNSVLVKICQSPAEPEPNWEFFLRVVDATGKGIAKKNVLTKK